MTSSRAEFLRDRNAMLEQLWEIDRELREWRDSGVWQYATTLENRIAWEQKINERHLLHDQLVEMNCSPWHFGPDRDSSWLCGPRKNTA